MLERKIYVFYCDDIRSEVGNKQSFMGLYNGEMIFPRFPVSLPKLCTVVSLSTPVEMPFKKLRIVALMGETTLAEIDIPAEDLLKQPANDTGDSDTERFASFRAVFAFSPLQINEPTKLRIRAYTESEELKGMSLIMRLGDTEEQGIFAPIG